MWIKLETGELLNVSHIKKIKSYYNEITKKYYIDFIFDDTWDNANNNEICMVCGQSFDTKEKYEKALNDIMDAIRHDNIVVEI
jgi:3-deoxy-D-manno-octulosonic acid (KDO) 8-phosphate synthase